RLFDVLSGFASYNHRGVIFSLSDNNVSAYAIGFNGALIPVPDTPFSAGFAPVSVAVDPTGRFAYVANKMSNNVSAYRIGPNGVLTPVPGSPFCRGGPTRFSGTKPASYARRRRSGRPRRNRPSMAPVRGTDDR